MWTVILWLLFGAVVGWLAGIIMKSRFGLLGNVVLGIIGSLIGGYLASLMGFGNLADGFSFDVINVIISVAGACLLIFVGRLFKK